MFCYLIILNFITFAGNKIDLLTRIIAYVNIVASAKKFNSWKMDETYIKIKGKWHYLYRAIDADGLTLDIWLCKKRDTQAAYAFVEDPS